MEKFKSLFWKGTACKNPSHICAVPSAETREFVIIHEGQGTVVMAEVTDNHVFFFHVSLHGLLLDSYRIIIRKMQYFCCQRIDNTDSICNLLTC